MPYSPFSNWLPVHFRLCEGDLAAGNQVIEFFLPWLTQRFCHCHPNVDEHLVAESVESALLDYVVNPARFDPGRKTPLGYWLWLQARGQLSHRLRRERRRRSHERPVGVMEKEFQKSLSKMEFEKAIYIWGSKKQTEVFRYAWERVLFKLIPFDKAGARLLFENAGLERWIQHLGIAGLSMGEKRRKVNGEKARLKKKFRRLAQRRGLIPPS